MNFLWMIIYLIMTIVLIIAIKDIVPWIRYIINYKNMGIKYHYIPFFGGFFAILKPQDPDVYSNLKKLVAKTYKNDKIIAFNSFESSHCLFLLTDPDLIKEFFIKEIKHTVRLDLLPAPLPLGIFLLGGTKALNQRAIFSKFFTQENLRKITPNIQKIIVKHLDELEKELWGDKKVEFKEYNLSKITPKIFGDMVDEILFGSEMPQIEGKSPSMAVMEVLRLSVDILSDPVHMMTFGIFNKLKLDPRTRRMDSLAKIIKEKLKKFFEKRRSKKLKNYGINILDLMLKHNSTASGKEKLTEEDILGNTVEFLNAGIDTTKKTTESYFKIASRKSKILEKLAKSEIQKIFKKEEDWINYDNYHKIQCLNQSIDEILRVMPVLGNSFPRTVTKKLKIGKYTIQKGSNIIIPIIGFQFDERNFENPSDFNDERMTEEYKRKLRRNVFMPFFNGKRNCIGKLLAELMLRMVIVNMAARFEIKGTDRESNKVFRFGYGVDYCDVLLKPRISLKENFSK